MTVVAALKAEFASLQRLIKMAPAVRALGADRGRDKLRQVLKNQKDFLEALAAAMREALPVMIGGGVAPVDLAQAVIGPGMGVYSRYAAVLRQDGKPVTVGEALQDIADVVAAYRRERTGTFDPGTRFCIDFYEQFGLSEAAFGDAHGLAVAYNVGIDRLEQEHLVEAEKGKVWLVPPGMYPVGVAGLAERPLGGSTWEACMRLAVTLEREGENGAAALVRELGEGPSVRARELAVWLYTIAEARKRPDDALLFNALDAAWARIQQLVAAARSAGEQGRFA